MLFKSPKAGDGIGQGGGWDCNLDGRNHRRKNTTIFLTLHLCEGFDGASVASNIFSFAVPILARQPVRSHRTLLRAVPESLSLTALSSS
jgi:hypothetical protein